MALSMKDIMEYIKRKQLIVKNFSETCMEPASYDIRLGYEVITSSEKRKVNIEETGYLSIEPAEYAVFTTLEYFDIPLDLVGNIGMKSKFARKGLILLAGLQIDPGFKGYLTLRVFNTSTQRVVLSFKDKIGMVQFIKLNQPATKPYSGGYQGQNGIPAEDISQIVESEGMTMGNVIKSLQGLIISITDLKSSQEKLREEWTQHEKRLEWIIGLMLSFLSVLVAIIAIV